MRVLLPPGRLIQNPLSYEPRHPRFKPRKLGQISASLLRSYLPAKRSPLRRRLDFLPETGTVAIRHRLLNPEDYARVALWFSVWHVRSLISAPACARSSP